MSLEQAIRDWDGASGPAIRAVYANHAGTPDLLDTLVAVAAEPQLARGATWLLKHHLEQKAAGSALTNGQIKQMCRLLDGLDDWGACLHILQCLPFEAVQSAESRRVADFLDRCLTNRRSMVRAWAYWGYACLASSHARLREEAIDLLTDAEATEHAGSIRVRVRRGLALLA